MTPLPSVAAKFRQQEMTATWQCGLFFLSHRARGLSLESEEGWLDKVWQRHEGMIMKQWLQDNGIRKSQYLYRYRDATRIQGKEWEYFIFF